MVRDTTSLEVARDRLALNASLAPDMAFGLPDLHTRRTEPVLSVLWLLRRDIEARDRTARIAAMRAHPGEVRDWTRPGLDVARATWLTCVRAIRLSRRIGAARGRDLGTGGERAARSFAELAQLRLAFGLRLLSQGRVLVSDRLHGAILALLMGIPHVALDNSTGKVHTFYGRWIAGDPLARSAESLSEAAAMAQELVRAAGR